jgi:hypothetical protein
VVDEKITFNNMNLHDFFERISMAKAAHCTAAAAASSLASRPDLAIASKKSICKIKLK